MSKVIANRLKSVLPCLISNSQSAFIPRSLIQCTGGLLTCPLFETEEEMKKRYMSLKLDRVEWDFLKVVMFNMGFEHKLIDMVMWCVRSISFFMLVNGEPKGPILCLVVD